MTHGVVGKFSNPLTWYRTPQVSRNQDKIVLHQTFAKPYRSLGEKTGNKKMNRVDKTIVTKT